MDQVKITSAYTLDPKIRICSVSQQADLKTQDFQVNIMEMYFVFIQNTFL